MHHRSVRELMTTSVVCARPSTTFKELVELLAEHDITAVPVVDDAGRPLGVVSEADLLRKEAGQEDTTGLLPTLRRRPDDRAKFEATTAEGLMTSPAVCARPEWTVVEAARVMERRRVKRLPVVDEAEKLIGLISRSDLLRVFLRRDRAIREEIVEDVLTRALGVAPSSVTVEVAEGRVTLSGIVRDESLIPIVDRLCRSVDGVVSVADRLEYRADGTRNPVAGPR